MKNLLLFLTLLLSTTNYFSQSIKELEICYNENSNVDIVNCIKLKSNELEEKINLLHNECLSLVLKEMKMTSNSPELNAIYKSYQSQLPILKKSLLDKAKSKSTILSATSIGGSGYETLKQEFYYSELKENEEFYKTILKEIKSLKE